MTLTIINLGDDWDSCLALDMEHPRPKFIQEVLQKSLR